MIKQILGMSCPSWQWHRTGQFEPYLWLPCGVTWDSSQTVVEIKLLRTSALIILTSLFLLSSAKQLQTVPATSFDQALHAYSLDIIFFASSALLQPCC